MQKISKCKEEERNYECLKESILRCSTVKDFSEEKLAQARESLAKIRKQCQELGRSITIHRRKLKEETSQMEKETVRLLREAIGELSSQNQQLRQENKSLKQENQELRQESKELKHKQLEKTREEHEQTQKKSGMTDPSVHYKSSTNVKICSEEDSLFTPGTISRFLTTDIKTAERVSHFPARERLPLAEGQQSPPIPRILCRESPEMPRQRLSAVASMTELQIRKLLDCKQSRPGGQKENQDRKILASTEKESAKMGVRFQEDKKKQKLRIFSLVA